MNTSPSGVAQCAATTGELPITATTDVLEPGVLDRAPEPRQRVHAAGARVDEAVVVVLPAGLVLLGAPVVVDGVEHGAPRRAAAPR